MPLNCGGIPERLLESELFGHVEGKKTGAVRILGISRKTLREKLKSPE